MKKRKMKKGVKEDKKRTRAMIQGWRNEGGKQGDKVDERKKKKDYQRGINRKKEVIKQDKWFFNEKKERKEFKKNEESKNQKR